MISYPDLGDMPADLQVAVARMVRLVNEMWRRYPDLDTIALSADTEIDRKAARIVINHVASLGGDRTLMLSPWDGRRMLEEGGAGPPLGDGPINPA